MKCPFEHRKYDFLSRSIESVVDSATIAGYLLVDRFFLEIPRTTASGCITPCSLPRLIKPQIKLSKLIISQTNCEIT